MTQLSRNTQEPAGIICDLDGTIYRGDRLIPGAREALEQQKSLDAHWAHLVIHGTLHLLGYDHVQEAAAQVMECLEINILNELGYPNPYDTVETS